VEFNMKSFVGCFFCVGLMASPVLSQPREGGRRGGVGDAGPTSPVVEADRRVTFRLRAPEAQSVALSIDLPEERVDLTKGDDGVWSVTLGPLDPDIYYYSFVVDGMKVLDQGNPQAKIGFTTNTITSILEVRGNGPAFYDVKDVPHGELRLHRYGSKSNRVIRELNVYVPPGYDADPERRYPVVNLLHGANNDHHSWHRYGRVSEILDNRLAEGAIEPFIVVMPLGYGGASADGQRRGRGRGGAGGGSDLYERDIIEDIVPLIDAKYRTIADRKHRAIIGFSMGGGQAGRIGLAHLDTFGTVGIMSAGMNSDVNLQPLARLKADVAGANETLDLLWIACGKDDRAFGGARAFAQALKDLGVEHTFVESEGAHHWRVWRRYLHDVSPLLFRN
jgi:enterochelin esterase family protein